MPTLRRRIIGVGNPDRGDDAVGLIVARRLGADGSAVASTWIQVTR